MDYFLLDIFFIMESLILFFGLKDFEGYREKIKGGGVVWCLIKMNLIYDYFIE